MTKQNNNPKPSSVQKRNSKREPTTLQRNLTAQTQDQRQLATDRAGKQLEYLENMMEPSVPFVTPGPCKWLYAVNLRTMARVPASTEPYGYAIVRTDFNKMLQLTGARSGDVTGWVGSNIVTNNMMGYGYTYDATLSTPSGERDNPSPLGLNNLRNMSSPHDVGGTYYSGTWRITGDIRFAVSVSYAGDYVLQISSYNQQTGHLTNIGTTQRNLASGVTTILAWSPPSFSGPVVLDNLVIVLTKLQVSVTPSSLEFSMMEGNLEKVEPAIVGYRSFIDLFANAHSATDLVSSSVGVKISGMSARLQNSTAELNRGGTLNMAQFPKGSDIDLPTDAETLFEFVSNAPSVMVKTAQPLKSGGHISFVPQDFSQLVFYPYPGPSGASMIFVWQNTPNPTGGYYQQDLTIEIRINIELTTLDPSLRLSMRSPLHFDYVQWFLAYSGTLESSSGCNPDHLDRIRTNAKKFINHPHTKILWEALKKVAPAALALL